MHMADKGLPSRIYKDFLKIDNKKLSKKWAKDLKKNFTKEDLGMANKPIKRSSTSLVIRNMQFKATIKYHFIPHRMAKINTSVMTPKVDKVMGQLDPQFIAIMASV